MVFNDMPEVRNSAIAMPRNRATNSANRPRRRAPRMVALLLDPAAVLSLGSDADPSIGVRRRREAVERAEPVGVGQEKTSLRYGKRTGGVPNGSWPGFGPCSETGAGTCYAATRSPSH